MVIPRLKRLLAAANEPVDAASLALFRAAFGTLLFIAATRFFTHEWIDTDYRAPTHFLHYYGFGWVRPLPHPGMYFVHGTAALAGLAIALGVVYRPACVLFSGLFTYAHLIDKSHYINHYYFIGLLSLLLAMVPLDREGSVRVLRSPADRTTHLRTWMLWLLRAQIAIVYFFGGLAKVGRDWLIEGEPLRIWLAANVELPLIGRYFTDGRVALLFAWGGMLFDLTIVPLLLWRRTRAPAYVAVVGFHLLTSLLFRIGMFPWIMMVSATLFFDPSWPRRLPWPTRWGARLAPGTRTGGAPLGRAAAATAMGYLLIQLLLPLRHFAYPGNTLWTEEGFRFAWRVMLIEKSGELELTVVDHEGRRSVVDPRDYLTPFQARMTATQPDMILELSHIVARDRAALTGGPVRVYADATVSFNGRMRARLIDSSVDLAAEEDGLAPKRWILPSPSERPAF
jgi:uncharacterized membrane protein YphA (DoxX/SURF4 family)